MGDEMEKDLEKKKAVANNVSTETKHQHPENIDDGTGKETRVPIGNLDKVERDKISSDSSTCKSNDACTTSAKNSISNQTECSDDQEKIKSANVDHLEESDILILSSDDEEKDKPSTNKVRKKKRLRASS